MTVLWFRPTALPISTLPHDTGFATMRVTSRFGWRDDPLRPGKRVFHGGLDIGNARFGDAVVAAADGVVMDEGFLLQPWSIPAPPGKPWYGGNYGGLMVILDHTDGYVSIYAHMRKTTVSAGDLVEAGQKIGEVGDTGSAHLQAHLHFGIKKGTADIDPLPLIQLEGSMAKFKDVKPGSTHERDIYRAAELGLLVGTGPDEFSPKESLTREQAATLAVRLYNRRNDR